MTKAQWAAAMPEPLDYRRRSPDDADAPDGWVDWLVNGAYLATLGILGAVVIVTLLAWLAS